MSLIEKLFKVKERGSSTKTEFLGAISAYLAVCYLFIVVPGIAADARDADRRRHGRYHLGGNSRYIDDCVHCQLSGSCGAGPRNFRVLRILRLRSHGPDLASCLRRSCDFRLRVLHFDGHRIRQAIIKAIPLDLKLAIVAGIGAFITIIGLKNAGIVVATPSTMIGLGNMMQPQAYLTILGVVLAGWMMAKGIRLALLITILIVAALGIVTGVTPTDGIHNLLSTDFKLLPTETIFQVDFNKMLTVGIVGVLFSITMVDLFDNMSTLIGLSFRAGFMDKSGNIPGLDRALISDSIATMGAGFIGTPTSTAILESAVGIEAGARTGLCALFLAGFFALTLFVAPLLTLVPAFATACVLIIVGYMMLQGTASRINFSDVTTGLPCFLTIFMMPFTFNIATGLAFGVISFVLLKLLAGKKEEITLTMAVLAVVFVGILISH